LDGAAVKVSPDHTGDSLLLESLMTSTPCGLGVYIPLLMLMHQQPQYSVQYYMKLEMGMDNGMDNI